MAKTIMGIFLFLNIALSFRFEQRILGAVLRITEYSLHSQIKNWYSVLGDEVEVTIIGELNNDMIFEGTDLIRVIAKGRGSPDLDGDGTVGLLDLVAMKKDFGKTCDLDTCEADSNEDCKVNLTDLVNLKGKFMK